MPRFHFSLGTTEAIREAGAVQSDSFDDALEALAEQSDAHVGDVLEIGVPGFPPARYEFVRAGRHKRGWRPANPLAA
jgi:hypothetical protein